MKPINLHYRGYAAPDSPTCWWRSRDGRTELARTPHDHFGSHDGTSVCARGRDETVRMLAQVCGRPVVLIGEPVAHYFS